MGSLRRDQTWRDEIQGSRILSRALSDLESPPSSSYPLQDFAAPETAVGRWAQERPIVTQRMGTADNSPVRATWRERDPRADR
jgi:hypothetical protein